MKASKYNSAIQKYFIQIKEIKDDVIVESINDFSEKDNQLSSFSNIIQNENKTNEEQFDADIDMIIID